MAIWAISDLHLSFSTPDKNMEDFGDVWKDYSKKIEENWRNQISPEDLVLIPGDISWAIKLKDALIDLEWIHSLPGTKLILKGNHDYWWPSMKKLKEVLPPSIHPIQNNSFDFEDVTIGGTRLFDTNEYNFDKYILFQKNEKENKETKIQEDLSEKIFTRELQRLTLSLQTLNPNAKTRIVMTHYPPISMDLQSSKVSKILQEYKIDICVFGHLHNVKKDIPTFGEKDHIKYIFASADYIDFSPIKIL